MTEEIAKAAGSFIDAFKKEPLSLALVAVILALLFFMWTLLGGLAAQREREMALIFSDKKEVREMLSRCVVPPQTPRINMPINIPLFRGKP